MSADDQGVLRAAHDGLGVVEHLRHRDPDGRLVAEDDLAERVADEQQRDAGLVEELGRREVVGGQHRDALAVGVQLGDVDDGQAADGLGSWRSCPLPQGIDGALSLRGGVALVQRDGDPVEQARRRPRACVCSGRSARDPSAARIDTRLVSVPKPEPGLGHVVRDEQVDALAPELVGGPLERARLRGEPDQDRDRLQRLARGGAVAVEAVGDPGDLGEEVRGRLQLGASGRRSRGELGLGRVDRPEVGDGRGHDQRVEAGGRRPDPGSGAAARRAARRSSRPGRPSAAGGRSTSTFAATSVTRAPRSSAASAIGDAHPAGRAIADEADRVDRLARSRRR